MKSRTILLMLSGLLLLMGIAACNTVPFFGQIQGARETSSPTAATATPATFETVPSAMPTAMPQPRGTGFPGPGQRPRVPGPGPKGPRPGNPGYGPGTMPGGMGGPPQGRGPNMPWGFFHHQQVPEAYAALQNPIPADETSLQRGQEIYEAQCASCHGTDGLGNGPAAASLNPPPAPIARTSCMLSDGYLYWRIHDGGLQWKTAMPAFGNTLQEDDIWHVINYIRSLLPCPNTGHK